MTICSIIVGMILIFLAKPIRRLEASITGRILHRRLHTAKADVFIYRCAGIAILFGGAYLYTSA
ncbi:MAG: hypothetical protein HRU15_11820 [Planctomycetes bacterium]|nr:hypothetical protein [Planctomycetota bacterium]